MANPIPANSPVEEKIAVLIPTTSPLRFNKGPPELPGLIGASVWIMSGIENEPVCSIDGGIRSWSWSGEGGINGEGSSLGIEGTFSDDGINRPRPLTIPSVIDPDKPKGFPIAATG